VRGWDSVRRGGRDRGPREKEALVCSDEIRDERMAALEDRPESEAGPPGLPDELIDELLAGARTPEQVTGPDGCSSS
jgi:hypothetical protein